jgi:hypothetical protein
MTCKNGHLEVAKWLYQLYTDIYGNVNTLAQIYPMYTRINISALNWSFQETCIQGHFEMAKWVYSLKPFVIFTNETFRQACSNGHLDVAKWLLQVKPDINISALCEWAFRAACIHGHLHVTKWLLQVKPTINITDENSEAFKTCCNEQKLELAEWLQQLKPYLYIIEYDVTGKIKSFKIREKEEKNWEKRKYALFLSLNKEEPNLLYQLPTDISKMVLQFM